MSGGGYVNITDRTELGFVFTLIFGFILASFSFLSSVVFFEYILDGSVSIPLELTPCMILFMIIFALLMLLNIFNGLFVSKISGSPQSLRALYISIFYPILLISFIIACFKEDFQTSFIFGFPFFILGAIILPYGAYVLNKEASAITQKNLVLVYCFNCHYPFEMYRFDKERTCPVCGALNRNLSEIKNDPHRTCNPR